MFSSKFDGVRTLHVTSLGLFPLLMALMLPLGGALPSHAASPAAPGESGIQRSESPADAKLYLISPLNGQRVSSPVVVRFGLGAMGVAPAGVAKKGTGHHHLVVDAELPDPNFPIPKSDHYRHFGSGQTEVRLELKPGTHTLQLILGDHNHIPHDPPVVSEKITITVE